jgi:inner membrane transporter RhtA
MLERQRVQTPHDGPRVASQLGGPSGGSAVGAGLALGAAALTMESLLLSRRLATASSGLDGIAVAVAIAALLTLPIAIPAALATDAAHELALVAAVGVLGLAVPYALEYLAIRRVSVRTFGVLLSLDPAIAALAGGLWLGQRLSAAEVLGVALVVLASGGAITARGRR